VGRGLATSYLETPLNSPNSNEEETESNSELSNTDSSSFDQKTSINSSDDDYRRSTSLAFSSGVTTRQTMPTVNRPTSASVINGTAFKAMSISGNICPRCSKTVYSAEEVKAAGKVKQFNSFILNLKFYSSHFINDVIPVRIVKEVLVVVDTQNVMVNFMITVRRLSIHSMIFIFIFRLLSTFIRSKRCRFRCWFRNIIHRKLETYLFISLSLFLFVITHFFPVGNFTIN
jgi:hypothetical protein